MALAELRGHWKTAILAYALYSVLFSLPAALLRFIFVGDNVDASASLIAAAGDGGTMLNSLSGADVGAFVEQRARSSVSFLYSLLISGPLSLGISGFALAVSRGATLGLGAVFGGFNNVSKAVGTYLLIAFRVFLWWLPFITVRVAIFLMLTTGFGDTGLLVVLLLLANIFAVVAIAGSVIAMITYSQAFFLLVDDQGRRVGDVLRQSRNIMVGNKKKLLFLYLSFIGWCIPWVAVISLSLYFPRFIDVPILVRQFALPILGSVLPTPLYAYMMVSGAVFYEIITSRRRSRLSRA
jgi:uncharacterized membrane protein